MLYRTLKDNVMKYFDKRSKYSIIVTAFFFSLILIRLAYLQIYKYENFLRLSENNRIRQVRVLADRGFIKDRNGFILVRNAPGFVLEIVKGDVKNVEEMLDKISEVVPVDKRRVMLRYKQAYMYTPVRVTRGLSAEQIAYFMEHSSDYQGLQFVVAPMRSYADSYNMAHVLGYLQEVVESEVNEEYFSGDIIGRTGIEKQYESYLRGKSGKQRVEVDSFSRVVEVLSEMPATPGKNILLTIDYNLQSYVSTLLKGRRASVVVLDGKDSSVLAMFSSPAYDLTMFTPFINETNWNKLRNDEAKPLLNRTIEGAYPPGSVNKIFMAVAGLLEGTIDNQTTFICNGSFKTSPKSTYVHNCWKRTGHGEVNLHKSLKVSCDVYYYNLGIQLGIEKMSKYAYSFALGRLTGINLPNEKTGVFPSKEWKGRTQKSDNKHWLPGDTVNTSIGQGYVTATPLQIAVMTSSIFNGGTVYVPRIVESVEDPVTGKMEREPVLISAKQHIPNDILKDIMNGMVASVEESGGTSRRGYVHGLKYGGKTGTAQVVSLKTLEGMKEEDIPENWRDHSWYTAVYPAENPRYTIVVMIENGGSGGRSSAPVGAKIISKMLELGYVSED